MGSSRPLRNLQLRVKGRPSSVLEKFEQCHLQQRPGRECCNEAPPSTPRPPPPGLPPSPLEPLLSPPATLPSQSGADCRHPCQLEGTLPPAAMPYNSFTPNSQPLMNCLRHIHSATSIFISNFNIVVFHAFRNIFKSKK